MALLEWRDEFCTGIKGVDYEHEALIRQINAVYAMIADSGERELIIDSLGEIYGSISAHFALEEQMMKVAQNQMDYQAATTLYSKSISLLRMAIGQGQR